jgi:hypothetical protein
MKPSDAELKDLLQSAQWIDLAEDSHGVELSMRQAQTAIQLAKAELQRRQQPASVPAEIAKVQPCGCVVCTCEDEIQCQGCGAKNCGKHPVGQFPVTAYGREHAQQWISVADEMPKSNKPVFIFYRNALGNGRTVKGFYCGHHERSTEDYEEFEEGGDWSEDGETKYWPAGWYESIENWEDYSAVAIYEGVPTHWCHLLPEPPTS